MHRYYRRLFGTLGVLILVGMFVFMFYVSAGSTGTVHTKYGTF